MSEKKVIVVIVDGASDEDENAILSMFYICTKE
jgi:hypothetical protein